MEITLEQIQEFSVKYHQDKRNKEIEKEITTKGLEKACINEEIIKQNPPTFNIELCETKRYDQKESLKCWIFAGINLIKRNVAENLNMDVMHLELSDNYIAFFDKLEKANSIYEKVIHSKTDDLRQIQKNKILDECVAETGNWATFLAILDKYGIMPLEVMPSTKESQNYKKIWYLYKEKVKSDVITLLENKALDKKKLKEIKERFLQENYNFLSKILGEPPLQFNYKYQKKNKETVWLKHMTPLEFRKNYITLNLKNYVAMGNELGWDREYNKIYNYSTNTNVYKKSNTKVLNVTAKELKKLAIKQLKDQIPVYVGVCIRKDRDDVSGVLDNRLYCYKRDLGVSRLNKELAMKLQETELHHWMNFTGVQIENGKPVRWKVEDSYGDKEKVNGYYVMNDNYFDDFVITIIVDKKYLNEEQHKLWQQKAKLVR